MKSKEGRLIGWVTACVGTPSKTRCGRKDRRKDRSDEKKKKKKSAATG